MKLWLPLSLMIAAVLLTLGCTIFAGRDSYETASYTVERSAKPFEIRRYPNLAVVATPMDTTGVDDDNGAFRRLFRYISKGNQAEQKIAMTTPVFVDMKAGSAKMYFVLPKTIAESGAPAPAASDVSIETLPGGLFAAYRYSGSQSAETRVEAEKKLREWIANEKLKDASTAIWAGYDPPFTPPALRRNEVLIRIEE